MLASWQCACVSIASFHMHWPGLLVIREDAILFSSSKFCPFIFLKIMEYSLVLSWLQSSAFYLPWVRLNQATYTVFGQMLRYAVFRLHENNWMLRNKQSSITSPNTITQSCVRRASNRQITRQIHGPMTTHTHVNFMHCSNFLFSNTGTIAAHMHSSIQTHTFAQHCRGSCYSFVGSLLCPTKYTVYFI